MIDLKKDYKDYLALLAVLAFSLLCFVYFSYDRTIQSFVAVATGCFYVLWGVIHHVLNRDFHFKVLVEYLMVAGLVVVLLLSLISRI